MTAVKSDVYKIPVMNFDALVAKVSDLNKRAKRLNLTPMKLEVVGSETGKRKSRYDSRHEYEYEIKHVVIIGDSPVLDGWELIAKITPSEVEGENFTKAVPGKECPVEFRTVDMTRCDHCNTRRRRNDTFVLRHESGEYKVVGRNCIADFLGHASPEALLSGAELLFEADAAMGDPDGYFGYGGGGYVEPTEPMEYFIAMSAIFIRRYGWTPKSKAYDGPSTAVDLWTFLAPPVNDLDNARKRKRVEKDNLRVTDEDRELAKKAMEWGRSLDPGKSDYLHNLRLAVHSEVVTSKTYGLVASLIPAYNRHVEKVIAEKRRAEMAKDMVHIGEVGKRYYFPNAVVMSMKSFETMYGVTTLITFKTKGGNIAKWFASGDKTDDYELNEEIDIVGTVKDHDEYKGRKETLLNRVSGKMPKKMPPEIDEGAPAAETPEAEKPESDGEETSHRNVPGTSLDFKVKKSKDNNRCSCGGSFEFSTYCGCKVCTNCMNHKGLARCYCGWSASGGDGRRELIEMGEVID